MTKKINHEANLTDALVIALAALRVIEEKIPGSKLGILAKTFADNAQERAGAALDGRL